MKALRTIFPIALALCMASTTFSQSYTSNTGSIQFDAVNKKGVDAISQSFTSKLDMDELTIIFSVPIQSFVFGSGTMQKHFNQEGNMNSSEFPKGKFKGAISSEEDIKAEGTHQVKVEGEMTIKGTTKPFSADGTLVVSEGKVEANSEFMINGFDFGMDSKKFADEVKVVLNAVYE